MRFSIGWMGTTANERGERSARTTKNWNLRSSHETVWWSRSMSCAGESMTAEIFFEERMPIATVCSIRRKMMGIARLL